jgi:hypothetical protein
MAFPLPLYMKDESVTSSKISNQWSLLQSHFSYKTQKACKSEEIVHFDTFLTTLSTKSTE